MLQFVNIHDTLEAKLLEVEPVSLIEIGRNSFGIVVNHDGPLAHVAKLPGASDSAPIELDTATDTINATSKNHGSVFVEFNIMLRSVVRCVQVVGVCRIFSGKSVNTLHEWRNSEGLAVGTNNVLGGVDYVGNLIIGEAHTLGTLHELVVNVLNGSSSHESMSGLDNVVDFVQVPLNAERITEE